MDHASENGSPTEAVPNAPKPILPYATSPATEMVTVWRYPRASAAGVDAARLTNAGIYCIVEHPKEIHNLAHLREGRDVHTYADDFELKVTARQAERAREILRAATEDLEPGEQPGDAAPILDERGQAIPTMIAAAFESVRDLRDSMTSLAAEGIAYFPPTLVPRGAKPPGTGKRFVIRVHESDLQRAQNCLAQAAEDGDDTPRCPVCKRRQVVPVTQLSASLLSLLGLCKRPEKLRGCAICHHRGPAAEFDR